MDIFWQLVRSDLKAFQKNALSESIDLMLWVFVVLLINIYLLPLFGVPRDYLLISFSGTLTSTLTFKTFSSIYALVSDIHGERQIAQKLILPLHPAWVFLATATSTFLMSLWTSIWSLPIALGIIQHLVPNFHLDWVAFFLTWIVVAAFFSVFGLWISSFVEGPHRMNKVFSRFIFPLWFFGGFQFTWEKLHEAAPWLAYLDLLNPYLYAMEAMRTAVIGPDSNLNFSLCLSTLTASMFLIFTHAFWRFKKQLDFV